MSNYPSDPPISVNQLSRILTAGLEHVHDAGTADTLRAMIRECNEIEDAGAVKIVYAPPNATPEDMADARRRAIAAGIVTGEDLADIWKLADPAPMVQGEEQAKEQVKVADALADNDRVTQMMTRPDPDDYVVAMNGRSVCIAFMDVATAERFAGFMKEGDWTTFDRWVRCSSDTAPQPALPDIGTGIAGARIVGGQMLAQTETGKVWPANDGDEVVGVAACDAQPGERVAIRLVSQPADPQEVLHKGVRVPLDLKQPAMDAGHPVEAAVVEPHKFEEHPTDPYFCKVCGGSHFAVQHDGGYEGYTPPDAAA